ncbi:4a-hydroxytetrahydrobiopterin dehydratase [Hydrogenobaculum acidophilum]
MEKLENGWIKSGKSIVKTYFIDDWDKITEFLIFITNTIKELDHHPDILFHTTSKSITIFLTTHSASALSDKDLEFAKRLDSWIEQNK